MLWSLSATSALEITTDRVIGAPVTDIIELKEKFFWSVKVRNALEELAPATAVPLTTKPTLTVSNAVSAVGVPLALKVTKYVPSVFMVKSLEPAVWVISFPITSPFVANVTGVSPASTVAVVAVYAESADVTAEVPVGLVGPIVLTLRYGLYLLG